MSRSLSLPENVSQQDTVRAYQLYCLVPSLQDTNCPVKHMFHSVFILAVSTHAAAFQQITVFENKNTCYLSWSKGTPDLKDAAWITSVNRDTREMDFPLFCSRQPLLLMMWPYLCQIISSPYLFNKSCEKSYKKNLVNSGSFVCLCIYFSHIPYKGPVSLSCTSTHIYYSCIILE